MNIEESPAELESREPIETTSIPNLARKIPFWEFGGTISNENWQGNRSFNFE